MITTKFGTFAVENNGANGVCLFMENIKIAEFPKVAWWDKDGIIKALDEHEDLINSRIAERVKKVNVTHDNAKEVLEDLVRVFGKENNGFFSSRLKQCINKLK